MQCGCLKLLDAREGDDAARPRQEEAARALCARWGCGAGGKDGERGTSDPLLRSVAKGFEHFAQVPEGTVVGCPFEGVFRGDGWPQELQRARVLVSDDGLSWPDALGRPLTAVDVDALVLLKSAENKLDRLKRAQDDAERKAREDAHKNGGR